MAILSTRRNSRATAHGGRDAPASGGFTWRFEGHLHPAAGDTRARRWGISAPPEVGPSQPRSRMMNSFPARVITDTRTVGGLAPTPPGEPPRLR
jgi:hypothetical protein